MDSLGTNGAAAQLPPSTPKAITDLNNAIRNALFALKNGPIDCAIVKLDKVSRLAGEVGNPRGPELANLATSLAPAFETVQLVEMCLLDLFPEP